MKTCFECLRIKPLTDFYAHKMMADGHLGKCKECTKDYVRDRYRRERKKIAAYDRAREKRPERKAQKARIAKLLRLRNPDKKIAWQMVSNALRDGRLVKKPCFKCGAKAQAHHEDYSKPLDVMWLCRTHHLERHGKKAWTP